MLQTRAERSEGRLGRTWQARGAIRITGRGPGAPGGDVVATHPTEYQALLLEPLRRCDIALLAGQLTRAVERLRSGNA